VEKLTELKKDWVSLLKRNRNLEVHAKLHELRQVILANFGR